MKRSIIFLVLLSSALLAYANDYSCELRFINDVGLLKQEGALWFNVFSVETNNELRLSITNCLLSVGQKVEAPLRTSKINLPANVNIQGSQGVLSNISGRCIIYEKHNDKWTLTKDETRSNKLAGALSDFTNFLVIGARAPTASLLGRLLYFSKELVLTNIPPYQVRTVTFSNSTNSNPLSSQTSNGYELSVINIKSGMKLYSRVVATYSLQRNQSTFIDWKMIEKDSLDNLQLGAVMKIVDTSNAVIDENGENHK